MATYNETLMIDECFGIDEANLLFRFTNNGQTQTLPLSNIDACYVAGDIDSLIPNFSHYEDVFGFGIIPFVSDMKGFSKAVRESDIFLTIFFCDKDGTEKIFKKRFSQDNNEAYSLSSKINKSLKCAAAK